MSNAFFSLNSQALQFHLFLTVLFAHQTRMWVVVLICFPAELQFCEIQASQKQKCKPFIFGKRSKS